MCISRDQKEALGQKGCCSARNMFSEVTKIKIPSPEKIRGGIQVILIFHGSTLVTAKRPSLIDALTGAPVPVFPPGSSEVVSPTAGVQMPFSTGASSLSILPSARVFVTAFYYEKFSILFAESQWFPGRNPAVERGKFGTKWRSALAIMPTQPKKFSATEIVSLC